MRLLFTIVLSFTLFSTTIAHGSDEVIPAFGFEVIQNVYPNPSSTGKFFVELSGSAQQQASTIKVLSLIGKEVYRQELIPSGFDNRVQIDISRLPKGIYILEVSQGEQTQTRRLSYTS